jgi:hypothetical protein
VFETLGKLVFLSQLGAGQADALRAAIVAVQQQNAAATLAADPYAALNLFVGPTVNNSRTIIQSLDRIALVAKSAVENFMRSIAGELGASATLSPQTLLSALATEMTSAEQTVEAEGHFYRYALDNWSASLPTAEEDATISDDLVTAELV